MHVCVGLCACVSAMPMAFRRSGQIPKIGSHRWLWATPCGCWELNPSPLEKQYVILTTEPSPQPLEGTFLKLSSQGFDVMHQEALTKQEPVLSENFIHPKIKVWPGVVYDWKHLFLTSRVIDCQVVIRLWYLLSPLRCSSLLYLPPFSASFPTLLDSGSYIKNFMVTATISRVWFHVYLVIK